MVEKKLFRPHLGEYIPRAPGLEPARLYGHLVLVRERKPGDEMVGNSPYTVKQVEDLKGLVAGVSFENLRDGRFNYARMLRLEEVII